MSISNFFSKIFNLNRVLGTEGPNPIADKHAVLKTPMKPPNGAAAWGPDKEQATFGLGWYVTIFSRNYLISFT